MEHVFKCQQCANSARGFSHGSLWLLSDLGMKFPTKRCRSALYTMELSDLPNLSKSASCHQFARYVHSSVISLNRKAEWHVHIPRGMHLLFTRLISGVLWLRFSVWIQTYMVMNHRRTLFSAIYMRGSRQLRVLNLTQPLQEGEPVYINKDLDTLHGAFYSMLLASTELHEPIPKSNPVKWRNTKKHWLQYLQSQDVSWCLKVPELHRISC